MIDLKKEMKVDKSKIITNYNNALKDEKFKIFVNKLKLNDEILMKHTSLLQESCIEYNNCLNCKNVSECKNKMIGYLYFPKIYNRTLTFHYQPCRYRKKDLKEKNHIKNIQFYNLPQILKEASWDKVDKRLAKRKETILWLNEYLNNYPNVNKGLYLHGSFGSGKTYLIVAMLNELAKKILEVQLYFGLNF